MTTGSGCTATYHRKVLKDIENKKIAYEISVKLTGQCDGFISSKNWAIMPKIPDGYIVDFTLK